MKAIFVLALLVFVSCANNDAIKMMSGFLDGIGSPAKNKAEILKCTNDIIWNMWLEVIPRVRLTIGDNPAHTIEGMRELLRGPMETLTFLSQCGEEALKSQVEFLKRAVMDMHKLELKLQDQRDKLFELFKSLNVMLKGFASRPRPSTTHRVGRLR